MKFSVDLVLPTGVKVGDPIDYVCTALKTGGEPNRAHDAFSHDTLVDNTSQRYLAWVPTVGNDLV